MTLREVSRTGYRSINSMCFLLPAGCHLNQQWLWHDDNDDDADDADDDLIG